MLSGGQDRSDWVRNLQKTPSVRIRVGDQWLTGIAHVATDPGEELRAREQIAAKYYQWQSGPLPTEWCRTALPIAILIGNLG